MNYIKISIVTPSYNQGEFIEATIKSVLSQEGDFYVDYIIMDGGSQDESVEIIKKYAQLLDSGEWPIKCRGIECRWVSEKDKGQMDAIDRGFAKASGDIGTWLNSDDVYVGTDVLAKVTEEFTINPVLEILAGDGDLIDCDGNRYGIHHVDEINMTELIYLDYHILQPATFLTKKVYKNESLDQSYNYAFDAEYFIRLLKKGYVWKKTNDLYASFRLYAETKTLSGLDVRYNESLKIARDYGDNSWYYFVSRIYKYWEMVLANKYPKSKSIKAIKLLLRAVAYKLILNKWWR